MDDKTLLWCQELAGISGQDEETGASGGPSGWHGLFVKGADDTDWPAPDCAAIIYTSTDWGDSWEGFATESDARAQWAEYEAEAMICGVCGSNPGEWDGQLDYPVCPDCRATL